LAIWLKARLALSLFITVAMWLALIVMWWFGVEIPNKLWLAILTWLLDIIPYIGPFISWILLFIIWMIYNTVWVAILSVWILFGVNLIQNNILTPLFMNRALWVNSVLILISMVIWRMII
jgi:predicted PurR-regulated permease PerM